MATSTLTGKFTGDANTTISMSVKLSKKGDAKYAFEADVRPPAQPILSMNGTVKSKGKKADGELVVNGQTCGTGSPIKPTFASFTAKK